MKLAPDSHQKLEKFFRAYFQDETFYLPTIHIYCGRFTHIFTRIVKVHGITFGCRIFILPDLVSVNFAEEPRLSEKLAAHEITHSLQYQKHGFTGFFYNYLKSFIKNLRGKKKWDLNSRQEAYLEIPFEIEAREVADKFVEWNSEQRKLKSVNL